MADGLVSKRTNDKANFEQFVTQLQKYIMTITIFTITERQINEVKKILPTEMLETFIGTMKIYQLNYDDREKPDLIQARRLSCITRDSDKSCLR